MSIDVRELIGQIYLVKSRYRRYRISGTSYFQTFLEPDTFSESELEEIFDDIFKSFITSNYYSVRNVTRIDVPPASGLVVAYDLDSFYKSFGEAQIRIIKKLKIGVPLDISGRPLVSYIESYLSNIIVAELTKLGTKEVLFSFNLESIPYSSSSSNTLAEYVENLDDEMKQKIYFYPKLYNTLPSNNQIEFSFTVKHVSGYNQVKAYKK